MKTEYKATVIKIEQAPAPRAEGGDNRVAVTMETDHEGPYNTERTGAVKFVVYDQGEEAPAVGSKFRISLERANSDEDGPFLRWLRASAEQEHPSDLVEWFMRIIKGEQTIADLRQVYEDGEFEEEEIEEG